MRTDPDLAFEAARSERDDDASEYLMTRGIDPQTFAAVMDQLPSVTTWRALCRAEREDLLDCLVRCYRAGRADMANGMRNYLGDR